MRRILAPTLSFRWFVPITVFSINPNSYERATLFLSSSPYPTFVKLFSEDYEKVVPCFFLYGKGSSNEDSSYAKVN